MRTLKFRVWDSKLGVMSYPEKNDATEFFIHFGGTRSIRCYDGYSEKTIVWDSDFKDRYTIQQFIGRKDKNGTDIYEGDIIQGFGRTCYGDLELSTQRISWSDEFCSFGLLRMNEKDDDCIGDIGWLILDCEVIGNIFEHSNLLEQ